MAIPRNLANIAPHVNASSTELVVNDGGANLDFRVEGDTNANLITANAGLDAVGLGMDGLSGVRASCATSFAVAASNVQRIYLFSAAEDNNSISFDSWYNSGASRWESKDAGSNYQIYKTGDKLLFRYDTGIAVDSGIPWHELFTLGASEVVVNEDGSDIDFRVEGDTNANLFFCDAGNDAIGLMGSPVALAGALDWVTGNVIYVPIGGSIADAITAATAGDTLQLAAGEYTIASIVSIGTKVHLKGQGQGITTILMTADDNMIQPNAAGLRISDMTIKATGARTGTVKGMIQANTAMDVLSLI